MSALISGRGSVNRIGETVRPGENVLLFARESTLARHKDILSALTERARVTRYTRIEPNPKYEEVQAALNELREVSIDCIVAVGGGSVIDFAKAFRYLSKRAIPLTAVPTTAGTGSEATQFAVIYKDGAKQSIDDPSLLPETVILDSSLSEAAPRALKASCAMDAYCQAIESWWARRATDESRGYALRALELCRSCLVDAVNTRDAVANEQMLLGAHLAGKAINISRTTAAHALSYKLTSGYGIPHGHAVALCMPKLFRLNVGSIEDLGPLLTALGTSVDQFESHFRHLMRSVGLETDLRALGVPDPALIVDAVNPQRLANNPRKLSRAEMMQLLQ